MDINDVRFLYVLSCFGLCLIVVSPTLATLISLPSGARFSELWLLSEQNMLEGYPFNVTADATYKVNVGVGNHIGTLAYYLICVKLSNQSEALPDVMSGDPSSLPALFEYKFFLGENRAWEGLVAFSFSNRVVSGTRCTVGGITINDRSFPIEKSSTWDNATNGFYYQLFFELWLYNMASQRFEYDNRFVEIWLNMTV